MNTPADSAPASRPDDRLLLETVVNHLPAAVCLIRGSDLRLQLVNPVYQAIAPGRAMVGKTLDELWPETGQNFTALCRRVLTTGQPHEVVDELNRIRRTPDGPIETGYFSWSLHRVRLPGDEGWGLLNAAWETTRHQQAEQALRESEQRFHAAFSSLFGSILLVSDDGRVEFVNQAFCDLFNLKIAPNDLIGLRAPEIIERVTPAYEHPEAAVSRIREIVSRSQPVEGEEVALREGRTLLRDFVPIVLEGKSHGRLWHHIDITERKRVERQLAADLDAMTRLQQLGTLFVKDGNLTPVLTEIVDAAIAISGADFGNIQMLDPNSSELRIVAQRGFPQWWLDYWNTVSKGRGTCGTALERLERVIIEDVERSPIFAGTPALEIQLKAGVRAVQSTPLLSRSGTPLGMFSTHYRTPQRPDPHTLALLDLLARQVADIIARTQAEEALRATNEELVRFNRAMVGRELRMIDLKKEINGLCAQLGQPPRYQTELAEESKPLPD
jgi:PAS domain S-box-containing protein